MERKMNKLCILGVFLILLCGLPLFAEQQTWENVPVVDGMCLSKVKADPDKHQRKCMIQCANSGYGLIDADGNYLKFDDAGNEKVLAILKESDKTDHIRMTIEGERTGDVIKINSATLK
jgi:hypothetical protein